MQRYAQLVLRRALLQRDSSLLQVSFGVGVLEHYRADRNFSIIRTDTAGRLKRQGAWSVDFGIAPGETTLHLSWCALEQILPEKELEHWASHVTVGELSENFMRMQISPGSCFDDGEVRAW